MQTELSFLISLLLNDITPKELKAIIADRIKEVETKYNQPTIIVPQSKLISNNPVAAMQSPSTIAAMERQLQEGAPAPIVASPAAAQALEARRLAMQEALAGPKPGQVSPTKFHGTK